MRKFYLSLAGLAVILSGVLLFNVFNGKSDAATLPRDCDNNSIIYCGAINAGELAQRYKENKTGDLPTIYNNYGISASMIASADSSAKMGEVRKDGTVVVNGEVVATNAMSIGRQPMSGSSPITIGGKKYYNSPPSTSFRSNSIAAYVFFDADGQFKSFIITSCGNPGGGTPVPPKPKPSYKCDGLVAKAISRNEYQFTASASAANGAAITNYTFDFGDGKSQTSTNKTVSHAYDKTGSYKARVTANVKVGNETKPATGPQCEVPVSVTEAMARCDALTLRTISAQQRHYAFDLTYTAENGATLKTVDYTFGDGTGQDNVSADAAKTVEHTYAKAGSYTTEATLHFDIAGEVKDVKCQASLSTSPEMCATNPSLPKGDEGCTPCPLPGKEKFPKNSPECSTPQTPTELPKTGPMDYIAGGIGVSSVLAAGCYWFMSRRDLIATLLNR